MFLFVEKVYLKGFTAKISYLFTKFDGGCALLLTFAVRWHLQVSLSSIKGTGPEGSIVKADIEEYLGDHLELPFSFCLHLILSGCLFTS